MISTARDPAWGPLRAAASLRRVAWLERAIAHVLAGWIPKFPDFPLKIAAGLHLHAALESAVALYKRVNGLTHATASALPLPEGWLSFMRAVDALPGFTHVCAALDEVVLPLLVAQMEGHLAATDRLADEPSCRLLEERLPRLRAAGAWLGAVPRPPAPGWAADRAGLTALCDAREEGAGRDEPWPLWPALDRVPRAVRVPGLVRSTPGSLGLLTVDTLHEPEDVAKFLHADLDEEITTLELMARNSYEHPGMPLDFHRDMARQAADEARHAELVTRLLEARGHRHGDFEVSTSSYDGLYAFGPCAAGSEQELLWRMLLRQTFMEGLALDSLAHDIRRRAAAGQHDIAHMLEYILSDEVFHCRAGVRWCTHLLGPDHRARLQARYEAHAWFTAEADRLRERWVIENLEAAMGELATLEEAKRRRGGRPPEHPLNRLGRLQAGLHEDDILQMLSWGYAQEEPPAA